MELIPAVDLLDGKVVRLHRGDYRDVTVYADDPLEPARRFHDLGATRLHVVDLDGARDGSPRNLGAIERIVSALPLRVQVGGGVRTRDIAARWLDAGAARVVLGTVAVKQPELAASLCAAHPDAIIVAVDSRGGEVAVEGWLEGSGMPSIELARQADAWGACALLHTVIERDGTREGPDVDATRRLQAAVRAEVIASGGIGSLDHIRSLREASIRAAVCGRALLSGAFGLQEAFEAAGG